MKPPAGILLRLAVPLAALGLGLFLGWRWSAGPASAPAVVHQNTGLKIEQVRKLASLVTLDVPISDVQTTTLSGYTGGVSAVILIKGDVQIATDLSRAHFGALDEQARTAVLCLPQPRPGRARLDHNATRVYQASRHGLWSFFPGSTGEGAVIDLALQKAQERVQQAADQPELIDQARVHAQQVLDGVFSAMGWRVSVEWAEEKQ